MRKDGELWRTKDFPEGYLEIDFVKRLEMLIFDAAAVNVKVNGQLLGPVGDSVKFAELLLINRAQRLLKFLDK